MRQLALAVRAGLAETTRRIRSAGADPEAISVIAVTKGHGLEAVRAALLCGLTDIGENYANELLGKAARLASSLEARAAEQAARSEGEGRRSGTYHLGQSGETKGAGEEVANEPTHSPVAWHYLGAIQRNKVARLGPVVTCWQSVSRAEEARAIASHTPERPPEIFVEVDSSGSPGRLGCPPADVPRLVEEARRCGCRVRGLMTLAPLPSNMSYLASRGAGTSGAPGEDSGGEQLEMAAEAFGRVADLARDLGLEELSMGMSADIEPAVAAGSTMVRLGTALFGPRSPRHPSTEAPRLQQ